MTKPASERGSVLVLFMLMIGVLLPMIGLAIDVGMLFLVQTHLQAAADAAALAGANSGSTAASAFFAANFPNRLFGATLPSGQPSISVSGSTATVTATVNAPLYLLRVIGFSTSQVGARAVASSSGSSGCVYALDTSMSRAFYGDATIDMGCGLSVASGANDALHLDGGSLTAANILINSAATYSYPSGSVSPTPTPTSASSLTDPLASMTLPTFSSCTYTNTSITTSRTLNPGTYCGGMTISNGASVTLNSGLYIITGGINWNTSGTTVNGTAVTLFFTQGGGSGYGNVTISGGVNTNLSAPTNVSSLSQGINGVLMATDRSWINTSQEININGGSNADLTGIIYAPGVGVIITGNTTVTGKYFGLVADNISVNGGASLTIPTPNYSSLPHGSPFPGGTVYLSQ